MTDANDQTYRRILEVAGARFIAYGFSNTTMDDVASQLGMSKKTVYRYFESKKDIVRTYVREQLAHIREQVNTLFANPRLTFVEQVSGVLDLVAAQLSRIGDPFMADLARHAPEVWREIEQAREHMVFSRLEGLIREGIAEGVVKAEVDPRIMVRIVVTVARNIVTPQSLMELNTRAEDVVSTLKAMMYEGILTDEGRTRLEEKEQNNDGQR
jgi:AcrR family transcriptional regulator